MGRDMPVAITQRIRQVKDGPLCVGSCTIGEQRFLYKLAFAGLGPAHTVTLVWRRGGAVVPLSEPEREFVCTLLLGLVGPLEQYATPKASEWFPGTMQMCIRLKTRITIRKVRTFTPRELSILARLGVELFALH